MKDLKILIVTNNRVKILVFNNKTNYYFRYNSTLPITKIAISKWFFFLGPGGPLSIVIFKYSIKYS